MNAWLLASIVASAGCIVALSAALWGVFGTPDAEDRRFRDRPPAFWRIAWPLVRPIAVRIAPLMSVRARYARSEALRHAGLEFALTPEQFVAGKLVAALLAVAAVALVWSPRGLVPSWLVGSAVIVGFLLPESWQRDRIDARRRAVLRELPFYLDIVTLAVESGLNLGSALAQAVDKGPRGPLRGELGRVLRDIRAGRGRAEALRGLAERLALPAIGSLVAALLIVEKQGGSLGPVLRAQAEQRRNERFLRAEKLAMEAPVKMLLPLLVFIFPCTFAVLLFPIASRLIEEGWLQ